MTMVGSEIGSEVGSEVGSEIGSEVEIVGDGFGVSVGRFIRTIGPGGVALVSPSNGA